MKRLNSKADREKPGRRARIITPLKLILSRLQRAHRCGEGWRADCPLGHKSRGTLALREADDGSVLLTCHAGCSAAEVLGAIGLTLADLFDRPPVDDSREGRKRRQMHTTMADWRAALRELEFEACIVAIAAEKIASGLILGPDDAARVQLAHERIADARRRLAP